MKTPRKPLFTPNERIGLIVAFAIAATILLVKVGCARFDSDNDPQGPEIVTVKVDSVEMAPVERKTRRDTIIKGSRKAKKKGPDAPVKRRSPLDEILKIS